MLELFVDCITEPNEKLVEFGVGGICNSCAGKSAYLIPMVILYNWSAAISFQDNHLGSVYR